MTRLATGRRNNFLPPVDRTRKNLLPLTQRRKEVNRCPPVSTHTRTIVRFESGFSCGVTGGKGESTAPTSGQNDFQELRMRPDKHDDFKLVGVYDLTGSYIPFFPFDLNGQEGIVGWFKRLEKQGFKITKLV
jgi:hypothetical protein